MNPAASGRLAFGVVALLGAVMAGTAEADPPSADPPFAARILDAVGALQTTVNNLQGTVNNLQSTVNNVRADTRSIQSNLGQIQPAWNEILPADVRFVPALNGEAILDQETGLVWEKGPNAVEIHLWAFAQQECNPKVVGARSGWRLPTIQELQSLVDPTVAAPGPTLPAGHPFTGVVGQYWSATTGTRGDNDKDLAWVTSLKDGFPREIEKDQINSLVVPAVWCVRGGQGSDPQ